MTIDVTSEFDAAAASYDRLVGASPGYHRNLSRSAHRMRLPGEGAGLHLLDLGCGTGASTSALLAAAPQARVTAVDASAGMLAKARQADWPARVSFVHARAEELAAAGVRGPFDGIFAAYLVRNLPDPDPVLAGLREALAPGAPLAVHDYALDGRRRSRAIWTAVCWSVIIPAGKVVTGRAGLYRYLWRSALRFDTVDALAARLRGHGLVDVRTATMPGWERGIVHTVVARRPA
ncbi:MAG: class I SAM-dependent methyltransferase [Pseudonocardiales bacterium]|nr:class I SAM-dependent methyltransferase [Pseudonocardiales bacterium]MBV9030636.1 class I SAM-dependent methyltransferase [Pseudonocardiales bacterium]MBW0008765.1 class I SAM-dependent methyltransferase [Pseudonocardiales bacterium]